MLLVKDLVGSLVLWGAVLIVIATLWVSAPSVFYWVVAMGFAFLIFSALGR